MTSDLPSGTSAQNGLTKRHETVKIHTLAYRVPVQTATDDCFDCTGTQTRPETLSTHTHLLTHYALPSKSVLPAYRGPFFLPLTSNTIHLGPEVREGILTHSS